MCEHLWAAVRPQAWGPLVSAVAAAAAGMRAICGSESFHQSAGLTDIQLLHTASGKPQGRFYLAGEKGGIEN